MAHEPDWNHRIAAQVGSRVAELRQRQTDSEGRKLTAQALADRCADLGHALDRTVIAKLEKGIRQSVTVADILVLARALRVPPMLLLFPVGEPRVKTVEILPGDEANPWDALRWFAGEGRFPIDNLIPGGTVEDGIAEWYEDPEVGWQKASKPLHLFRRHDQLVDDQRRARHREYAVKGPRAAGGAVDPDAAESMSQAFREQAESYERALVELRQSIRDSDLVPPRLPEDLAWLESPDESLKQIARMRNTEVRVRDDGRTTIHVARSAPPEEGGS